MVVNSTLHFSDCRETCETFEFARYLQLTQRLATKPQATNCLQAQLAMMEVFRYSCTPSDLGIFAPSYLDVCTVRLDKSSTLSKLNDSTSVLRLSPDAQSNRPVIL